MSVPTPHLVGGGFAYEQDDDWAKVPAGYEFPEAAGVAVDESDNLFVFNRGPHPVLVFDKNGNFLRSFGEDTFTERAHGIHLSPDGFCYLIDDSQHCVHKFDMNGNLVWTLGEAGKPAPKWSGEPFNRPTHIGISPKSGDMYVTDGYGNSRVHRYDGNGKHIISWGQVGTDPGEFCNPHNVIVDEDENIYVCDRENNRVQVFDNQGKVQAIGTTSTRRTASAATRTASSTSASWSAPTTPTRWATASRSTARTARGLPDSAPASRATARASSTPSTAARRTPRATSTWRRSPTRCADAARTRPAPTRACAG